MASAASHPSSKVAKPPHSHSNRREGKSPAKVVSVKRRRVTKSHPSPRRKLLQDAITSGTGAAASKAGQQPHMTLIPATKKKGADFRSGPGRLP